MANNKVLQAVVDIAGTLDPSVGKMADEAAGFLESLNLKAIATGAAIGGVAIKTGQMVMDAGRYLKDLGTEFDAAADNIRIGTGATGEDLEALLDDFDAVFSSIPTSMEDVGVAIADFNTRLGLTGPELQELSAQAIQVSDMLGDNLGSVIEESSQAFQQWSIDAEDMADAMDYIFKASQDTGMGFTDLMTGLQRYGPQLQEIGYSFEEAAAMMGQFDKAGVNVDEVLGAMKKSVGALAKEGIEASDGLAMYIEQIENAGTAAEATAIANEVFGARAGSTMASAIRDGTFAVDELTASLLANGETIAGAAEDTYDFGERLQVMKQQLQVALKPMANTVFDSLNKFMPVLQRLMEKIIPVIAQAVETAMPFVEEFLVGMADALDAVLPMIADLADALLPVLMELISTLLPPLLSLVETLLPPLMEIVQAILPPLAGILLSILPMLTEIAAMILPVIAELIAALLPALQPLLNTLLEVLQKVIMPLMEPLSKIIEALLPVAIALLDALMPVLTPILGILGPIADLLATVVGWIAKVVEWVASGLGWVVSLFTGEAVVGESPEGYATGGFTNGLSIAGEDPRYPQEAVLSFNPAYRAQNLSYWARAGRMLGASEYDLVSEQAASGGGTTVTYDLGGLNYAPKVIVYGDADEEGIARALRKDKAELKDMFEQWWKDRGKGRYDDDEPLH